MPILFFSALALVVSFLLTPLIRKVAIRLRLLDLPNERSSHGVPTPRLGGLGILAGIAVAALASRAGAGGSLWIGAIAVALIGGIDDVRPMRQWPKLLVHLAAAASVASVLAPASDGLERFLMILIGVVFVAYSVNAYNFMDGINGIAASLGVVAGATYALLLVFNGDLEGALVAAATAGACAGFLPWNFPKASIFMGDVGSGTLGFLFGALALRAASGGIDPATAILPLAPILCDTGLTLARRVLRGERFLSPHRQHLYQRMVDSGSSHASVTLMYALLAGIAGGATLLASADPSLALPAIAAVLVLYVGVGVTLGRRMKSR